MKDKWEAKSRYKIVNDLIYAARANGDYYTADEATLRSEDAAVLKVDKLIQSLKKKAETGR